MSNQKLFFMSCFVVLALVSCKKKSPTDPVDPSVPIPTWTPVCDITLTVQNQHNDCSLQFKLNGGSTITVLPDTMYQWPNQCPTGSFEVELFPIGSSGGSSCYFLGSSKCTWTGYNTNQYWIQVRDNSTAVMFLDSCPSI